MVLCYIAKCNAEAYIKLMMYYYSSKYAKKPFCRAIIRACENHARGHARGLSDENLVMKIQILS